MESNYDFKNANINIEYSETANGYYIEISAKDFWNSITNEEMKKDISEYYNNNITAETLNQEFKGYNTNIVKAIKETTGVEGIIYEITITEEPTNQTKEKIKMNTYTDFNKMKTIVEDEIRAADKNIKEYDIYEITNELSEYDVDENTFTFTEELDDAELFWEIVEQYKIEKDFSDVSNNELLESFEEATADEYEYDEFTVEQLRKEILNRMSNNYWPTKALEVKGFKRFKPSQAPEPQRFSTKTIKD